LAKQIVRQICRRISAVLSPLAPRAEKGRTLTLDDIEHYQAIIPALMRTRALMQKLSALSKDWLKQQLPKVT
jgi:hypothetical protein